ncbi:unnamed protein product [Withania somnifera]
MGLLTLLLLLFFSAFFTPSLSQRHYSPLNTAYYRRSCPRFEQIMQETTTNKQINSPTTAAATLRLFFHDCFVGGCDSSVLISSTPFNKAELIRAKTALELACPGVVSCSDILAIAARNLVVQTGGPFYPVKLGRKDSFVSKASLVEGNLPRPAMPMDQMIKIFESKGFSIQEMVALSGAHTIGFSHCKEFSSNLYNFNRTSQSDPSYNPRFAQALRSACGNYQKDPTLSVFNDIMSPNKFDNMYYQNLPKGLGLLSSDRGLFSDPRTRIHVEEYIRDQNAFFKAFASAMQRLSEHSVKFGRSGEIRHRCDAFNN